MDKEGMDEQRKAERWMDERRMDKGEAKQWMMDNATKTLGHDIPLPPVCVQFMCKT